MRKADIDEKGRLFSMFCSQTRFSFPFCRAKVPDLRILCQVDLLYQFSPDEIHGLIGADVLVWTTKEELEKFVEELKQSLAPLNLNFEGGSTVHSDPECYDLLPPEGKSISVLGLRWHLKTDSLTIDLRDCVEDDTPVTKGKNFVNRP
ncbi:hypothetical protein TNIN_71571 [Trichonephila inaurata madagascariensis]|uniref:Uncharacterized protein n=1 Tax=Trichonephila inaurata madagascariensis TaxID=2747483 RepID=A0A8X6MKS8_9ARAC|nr:hypothetical protein TNIN_71571 [Trichonephila inaurata madagascariensis]